MKIALVGQAAFAEKVMVGLLENGHEIAAHYCPPDAKAGRTDPSKTKAQELGIPVHQHRSLKKPEVQAEWEALGADLGVLAYVTQIVPPNVFEVPRLGSICFHPSMLPRFRGGSAVNWQIIEGETETGVTVFWVDEGIDTGPVLLQRRAQIGPDDTAGSLYYDTLFPLGVQTVLDSVEAVAAGTAGRQVQDESKASYEPLCRDEHAAIDWEQPAAEVYNLIRGCDPQPGAYTTYKGEKLRLFGCRLRAGAGFEPGSIAEASADGLVIGAKGGAIEVGRVRFDAGKVPAGEFAVAQGFEPGVSPFGG